jgi:Zn-dependent peptidase ImmA (M78 family)
MTNRAIKAANRLHQDMVLSIPIDIYMVSAECGVAVRTQPLEEEVSGVLVIKEERAIIGVNENHHVHRQRFTIAHELGHFLLHKGDAKVFVDASKVFFRDGQSSKGNERHEIEANTFAAELLMPEARVREIVDDQRIDAFDETAVRRLAAHFEVSAQSMAIRLIRLGLTRDME